MRLVYDRVEPANNRQEALELKQAAERNGLCFFGEPGDTDCLVAHKINSDITLWLNRNSNMYVVKTADGSVWFKNAVAACDALVLEVCREIGKVLAEQFVKEMDLCATGV